MSQEASLDWRVRMISSSKLILRENLNFWRHKITSQIQPSWFFGDSSDCVTFPSRFAVFFEHIVINRIFLIMHFEIIVHYYCLHLMPDNSILQPIFVCVSCLHVITASIRDEKSFLCTFEHRNEKWFLIQLPRFVVAVVDLYGHIINFTDSHPFWPNINSFFMTVTTNAE